MSRHAPRHATDDERRRVRARAGRDPRRRELAGARVRLRRRHAAVPRLGARARTSPSRRARVRRPRRLVGSGDPGPRAPRGRRGGAGAAGRGLSFGAPTGRPRPSSSRRSAAGPPGRARAPRLDRHRGDDDGASASRAAFTGRDLLVKFAGCYHGHADALLARPAPASRRSRLPGSAGVPAAVAAQTLVAARTTTSTAVEAAFAEHGDRIAAVITEAAPANMGVVPPLPGFNARAAPHRARARRAAHPGRGAHGLPRRVLPAGGGSRACARAGRADLLTFGKVIGGGMPVAALGGRRRRHGASSRPLGPVYQAGTLSGNPVATAAGLATLRLADAAVYARVDAVSAQLRGESPPRSRPRASPHAVQRAGQPVQHVLRADAAAHGARDYAAVLRPGVVAVRAVLPRAARRRACTRRRRCSRRGSSPRRTTTPRSTGSSPPSRPPSAPPRRPRHRPPDRTARRDPPARRVPSSCDAGVVQPAVSGCADQSRRRSSAAAGRGLEGQLVAVGPHRPGDRARPRRARSRRG